MINWIKKNKVEFLLLSALILVAVFLRFYRLDEYMTFLGDEGRDAIVVKRMLTELHPALLGPVTSVGNMYLGPLYYYMMAFSMAFFWLNPVAAAWMVALIGVLTVGLIYFLMRDWFGKVPAFVAAFLYCISPVTVYYSRSSWNPNPAPFFALLGILGLHQLHKTRDFKWLILTGVATAFVAQMHYLALLMIPVYGLIYLYELRFGEKNKQVVLGTVTAVIVFIAMMSPLLFFDLRHGFMNFNNMRNFFTNRETTVNLNAFNSIGRILPNYFNILIGKFMAGENMQLSVVLGSILIIPVLTQFKKWPIKVLAIWLVVSVLGLALYKQNVYVHYLGFINPVPFMLFGSLFVLIPSKLKAPLAILAVMYLAYLNIPRNYLLSPPQNQLQRTQQVAQFVINKSEGKDFNFALIAKSNYDAAYQYYLDLYGNKPKVLPENVTDQLFVVCEDAICEPINNPKYEIAAFGWAKIDTEENFNGVKVFKLVANKDGK